MDALPSSPTSPLAEVCGQLLGSDRRFVMTLFCHDIVFVRKFFYHDKCFAVCSLQTECHDNSFARHDKFY